MRARPDLANRMALAAVLLATAVLLGFTLAAHSIPLYGVETDLLADSFPAARALASGHMSSEAFAFRGPGYPLLLAAATPFAGGDEFLAARLVNVAAAAASLAVAYLLIRALLGAWVGLAVVIAMALNPVFVAAAIEAGTDLPALALALAATWLAARPGGWRSRAAAGLVAGAAYLTRYNMVFLAPAAIASLWVARRAPREVVAWALGFVVPVGAWALVHVLATGALPENRNYVNVAYEVYGRQMGYDRFWVQTGNAFHSFLDVLRFDPPSFAWHVARNAATRWLDDARTLMPVWLGVPALIGTIVAWRHRPGWRPLAIHAGLAYLVLTLVFYTPRFFLYLLPFYLSGTFGLLLHVARERLPTFGRFAPAVAVALLLASGWVAVGTAGMLLMDPPVETRVAGELLRTIGRPGERVMARKPHVAYFARMTYVPIPYTEAFADFLDAARTRADYLFVSGIETALAPQLSVLADGVRLPGLEPIAHELVRGPHYLALYRIDPRPVARQALEESLLVAIQGFAARRPGEAWPQTYLGGQLVTMARYREALAPLAEAERLDAHDALIARFQAIAHAELGELHAAAADCERALALVPGGAWEHGYLGHVRLLQGRIPEARAELQRAIAGAPTDPRYRAWLATADSMAAQH